MVSVMKIDKAPLETFGDIGGLESQVKTAPFLFKYFVL